MDNICVVLEFDKEDHMFEVSMFNYIPNLFKQRSNIIKFIKKKKKEEVI